jgi:hypothetical protein
MKSLILSLALVLMIIISASITVTYYHVHAKKSAVTGDGNYKERAPKNDLMLWESLSSHLLSLN